MLHVVGRQFGCSNCSKQLAFRTENANCLICPACQTKNLRLALTETVGEKAEKVREEMSILKLRTTGNFRERTFEVVGRIQYFFQDSYRNHWHIVFDNGETGWLGDWAGNYSIFQEMNGLDAEDFRQTAPGSVFELHQIHYEVEMLDEHRFTFVEGEIPDHNLAEKHFITLYLTESSGPMMLVNIFQKKKPDSVRGIFTNVIEAFVGQYVTLSDLKLENSRNYDEWR